CLRCTDRPVCSGAGGSRVKVSSCSLRRLNIRQPEVARAAILFMAAPRHRRVSGRFRRQRVANKVLSKPAVSERRDIWKNMWHGRAGLIPELPAGVLRISDVTHSAMKLKWDAAPGNVRKYILTYKPDEGDAKEMEVNGDITSLDLGSLMSQSEYDVAVTPVYDQGPGTPMLGQAITDVVPAPKDLRTSEVTQTSFRVTWAVGAPDVAMYRLGWAKKGNPNYEHAILSNDDTTHVLEGLDIDTDYDVTVTAIYPDESESEDLIGHERTLLKAPAVSTGPPTDLVVINATTTSLTPKWGHAPGPVQNYKITYQPSAGGKTLTVSLTYI
ncbi:unnamed protein product, partial [Gadus morhua 'NCC']